MKPKLTSLKIIFKIEKMKQINLKLSFINLNWDLIDLKQSFYQLKIEID